MAKKTPSRKLSFAIMCRGPFLEEWQAHCVEYLLELGVQPKLLILDQGARLPFLPVLKTPFRRQLYMLYRRSWFRKPPRHSKDMRPLFGDLPTVTPKITLKGKYSQYFDDESLETIRSHAPDFILRFAFNIIRGGILNAAPYGVWSFHHGDETKYRGSPAGFWEIYLGDKQTGAILQRLTDRLDGGVVLKRGSAPTVTHSYVENIRQIYETSARWPAQVCADIQRGAADYFQQTNAACDSPIYHPPDNTTMVRFFLKLLRNRLQNGNKTNQEGNPT